MMTTKIWVNGCFDVLHAGHVQLFHYAKNLGTELRVGIDSDQRVVELKGKNRPIHSQDNRKFMLESLECIDSVVIYESEQDMVDQIRLYSPDLMLVGNDYRFRPVVGEEFSRAVAFYRKHDGHSTTNILKRLDETTD